MITIEEFMKCEFVVARVIEAKEHPNADKLLVLKVDVGGEERQLVAGIRKSYAPENLIGRRIVMVKNLQPAVIRGEESQGMILAASDEDGVSILQPDREVKIGARIK
ncbi:MAG: methionine--tRNA ligase subunit beta [Candidatus Omnitrophica bacterium]|nr:methionine--tRNA ligase subunit beta [Candidatus Omnitrophota bacterium]MCB9747190.1 methionine--tRNA ligase subunit beta [Candidatus Omnitrophota bacterium]